MHALLRPMHEYRKHFVVILVLFCIVEPMLGFATAQVYASEPAELDGQSSARVIVKREGDTSRTSIVTVYTKEGSATSGTDYVDKTQGRLVNCRLVEKGEGEGTRQRLLVCSALYLKLLQITIRELLL